MDKLHLPQWHSPEHVRDILLALPEKKNATAPYTNSSGSSTTIIRKAFRKAKPSSPPCACSGTTRVFRGWKTSNAG